MLGIIKQHVAYDSSAIKKRQRDRIQVYSEGKLCTIMINHLTTISKNKFIYSTHLYSSSLLFVIIIVL